MNQLYERLSHNKRLCIFTLIKVHEANMFLMMSGRENGLFFQLWHFIKHINHFFILFFPTDQMLKASKKTPKMTTFQSFDKIPTVTISCALCHIITLVFICRLISEHNTDQQWCVWQHSHRGPSVTSTFCHSAVLSG